MEKELKLMLIDDDEDDRELFLLALEGMETGCSCVTVNSCSEALKMLHKGEYLPDFIFLDLNMPLMDGKQFLEKIKKEPAYCDIPIAIYSTSSAITDKEQTIGMGANYFVTKPNRIDDIVKILHNILS